MAALVGDVTSEDVDNNLDLFDISAVNMTGSPRWLAKTASRFAIGKLPIATLKRFLRQNRISDRRVVVGPGIGEDAAVIDTGGPRYLYCHRFRQCWTREQGRDSLSRRRKASKARLNPARRAAMNSDCVAKLCGSYTRKVKAISMLKLLSRLPEAGLFRNLERFTRTKQ